MTYENIVTDDIKHLITILSVNSNAPVVPAHIAVNQRVVDWM